MSCLLAFLPLSVFDAGPFYKKKPLKQEISSRHPGEACAMAGSLGAHALLFVFAALALTLSTASQKIYSDESVPLGEAGGKNCSAQTQKEYYEMWQSANVKLGTALQSADYCHHAQVTHCLRFWRLCSALTPRMCFRTCSAEPNYSEH